MQSSKKMGLRFLLLRDLFEKSKPQNAKKEDEIFGFGGKKKLATVTDAKSANQLALWKISSYAKTAIKIYGT